MVNKKTHRTIQLTSNVVAFLNRIATYSIFDVYAFTPRLRLVDFTLVFLNAFWHVRIDGNVSIALATMGAAKTALFMLTAED
jgi:hypothetical protein